MKWFWNMRILKYSIILAEMAFLVSMFIFGSKFLAVDLTITVNKGAGIGEEIIVYFNQPIVKKDFEDNFKIENPDLAGEFIWQDLNREVHIIPYLGFEITNEVKITKAKSFAFTSLKNNNYFLALKQKEGLSQNTPARTLSPIELPQVADLPIVATVVPEEIKLPPVEVIEIKPKKPAQIKNQPQEKLAEISDNPPQSGKYIEVDIGKMTITAYDNKDPVLSYAVAGIGNPAASPTPIGQFKVLSKEERHFSSLHKVWMPWSVNFYGPYFLHGIPYWPNGEKLNTRYSGGCVRLPEEADKAIYDFVEVGTPIIVYKSKNEVSSR